MQAATNPGGKTTDTQGALGAIAEQPSGSFLLSLVAIGLVGYVLWRFVQAIMDPEPKGTEPKGIVQRLDFAMSGLAYASLALSAVQLVLGSGDSNQDASKDWTARMLVQPFGRWFVIIIGVMVMGRGMAQLHNVYSAKFREKFKLAQMSPAELILMTRLAKLGLAAREIILGLIGAFLIQAALQSNPNKAQGLDGVLQELAQQRFGPWILGTVATGLVAYGIYTLAQARYRQIAMP